MQSNILARYALAFCAIVALPVSAHASIIYSGNVNQVNDGSGHFTVSMDGVTSVFDLSVHFSGVNGHSGNAFWTDIMTNAVLTPEGSSKVRLGVGAGTVIGTSTSFDSSTHLLQQINSVHTDYQIVTTYSRPYSCGLGHTCYDLYDVYSWLDGGTRNDYQGEMSPGYPAYVGVQFTTNEQQYYGWAQIQANVVPGGAQVELLNYAYESNAGQSIRVGQTVDAVPEPASVALFAMGAAGLAATRRRAARRQKQEHGVPRL